MKRSVEGFNGISFVDEEESKVKKLLNELLELQKDFVSKKRKLQAAKLKKESILAEILFLKQRRRYLLKSQSSDDDNGKNISHLKTHFDAESEVPKVERSNSGYDAVVESARPAFTSKFNSEHHEVGYEELSAGGDVLRMECVPKNYLVDDNNRVGKKELSWHGQVTLKV
ncbi:uncharacterized protein LOC107026878 isoform X1 [Solanum pennellii]|uniref:Uncharacterized protein LOC107021277 isoform X1 n=1 Tax=Solanum pennellii TaxID=28526 RepID=A0ABM1GXK7_SOLPN|nr:uncharacterized protein LOC107021277 isoform X1 [Solanum pennellii]XP_015083474.1 uncharacterized protein LOC107026878 isoform X1 [Solanum pennellii]